MSKIGPIKPGEIATEKKKISPDAVFESFNELIAQEWDGHSATIKQEEVLKLMENKGLNRGEIFKKGWLNVEDAYKAAGCNVQYDKPAYNESYPAIFTFRIKRS